ncbi:MAG: hypothetical protein WAO58_02195 [Fimbriimonadaceae bacterium]
MTRDDFAFVADALLTICENESEAPFYTDQIFKTKLKQSANRESIFDHLVRRSGNDELMRSECDGIIEKARLTARQERVLSLKLAGHTFDEIGRRSGHSKQGAQSIFSQALKKLVRSIRVYPYVGLSDVYRLETRRGLRKGSSSTMKR